MSFFSSLLSYLRGPDPEPDPEQSEVFALRIHAMLTTAGVPTQLDLERFALRHEGGQVSYLGNHYDYWKALPDDDREAGLMRICAALVELASPPEVPDEWDTARDGVLLRLQALHVLHATKIELAQQGNDVAFSTMAIELAGTIGIRLVFDTPRSIVQFSADQLQTWGVDVDTAHRQGLQNLRLLAPNPFVPVAPGQWVAAEGDCYDSTRLLLVDDIAQLPVDGRHVALPANRDTLFITGDNDTVGLHRMLEVAMTAIDEPRLDTLQPLVLVDGQWETWTPPPGHELHAEFRELGIRTLGGAYADLSAQLKRSFEADGTDVFVASFGALEMDGVMHSYAVWAPIPTWLPRADLLAIATSDDPEEGFIQVPMATVLELAGDELKPVPDLRPHYWSAEGRISDDLLDRLREHAVDI